MAHGASHASNVKNDVARCVEPSWQCMLPDIRIPSPSKLPQHHHRPEIRCSENHDIHVHLPTSAYHRVLLPTLFPCVLRVTLGLKNVLRCVYKKDDSQRFLQSNALSVPDQQHQHCKYNLLQTYHKSKNKLLMA